MAKVVSRARLVRLNYQAKQGRPVQLKEVAAATGITESTLSRIETGKTVGVDFDTLAKLCAFYDVDVGDILEFDPDGIQTPGMDATAYIAA